MRQGRSGVDGWTTLGSMWMLVLLLWTVPLGAEDGHCSAWRPVAMVPTDTALCAELASVIREPDALPLNQYQEKLGDFLRNFCHRDADAGWQRDKTVRDTGPFIAQLEDGAWTGSYHGTHAPVVIWYSPKMLEWLKTYRGEPAASNPPPIPDGAVIVKEMFPAPAALCADEDPLHLLPTSGAAIMVRDSQASQDGWFWGWFGWSGWDPDWPAGPTNRYPYSSFAQYCLNCHASAANNSTFASLVNVEGEAGEPLVFLSQHFYDVEMIPSHHRLISLPTDDAPRLGEPLYRANAEFVSNVRAESLPKATWNTVSKMPSETYDFNWVSAGELTASDEFLTSSQCLGCHDAGSTGLQYDMTEPNPHGDNLLNLSPYGTWRTSPMGLGGRDPIFYAQLASETETFHPEVSEIVQNTCLGCHGIMGQRQFAIDTFHEKGRGQNRGKGKGECKNFLRDYANAVPWPNHNPLANLAEYGGLARDGISCTACHRMLVGQGDGAALDRPENLCVQERQEFLNPDNTGFAKTFTGSFLVGPPDELYGPFEDPKTRPMEHALGIEPMYDESIRSSELCGSCHTVHLPVMQGKKILKYTYEQTTYPEWAFSAYRTGTTPEGDLPFGAGDLAESCQSCHMPSKDEDGTPFRSKIASIQEFSNFPQAENTLPPEAIDLDVREGFARHTLVGLNVFFVKMAQQFPDVLGIRTQDPMMVDMGLDPLLLTEQKMLDQASNDTATIAVETLDAEDGLWRFKVDVESKVGHKFPSGVGFRRLFIEFSLLDAVGNVVWASGRTNGAGLLVDQNGDPLPGELWWTDDCSELISPETLLYQPHYQRIDRQDQVQIYQELVTAPSAENPKCDQEHVTSGPFTTSFLSICGHVKDNRLLPHGFLPLDKRIAIAKALGDNGKDGPGVALAKDSGSHGRALKDPDYKTGGGDSLIYAIDPSDVAGQAVSAQATLYYQAIPPYYLQDRFCTSKSRDTQRLQFLASHLNLQGTEAEDWKFELVSSGMVDLVGGP